MSVPFTDFSDYKVRPAMVVSNTAYNNSHPDHVFIPITSEEQTDVYDIAITEEDIPKLCKPPYTEQWICCDKVFLAETTLVQKFLVAAPQGILTDALSKIGQVF